MRVGYISAVANNDCEITPECITAAIAFAEWQERVRTSFQPGMARNQSAQCMEAILPVIAKITDWFRWRDLVLKKSWSKTWGTLVTQCKDNLVREGTLEAEYGTDDHGRTTSRPTGVVRYVPPTPRKGKSATPVAPLTPPSLR
jgi:hypothetical protein